MHMFLMNFNAFVKEAFK